MKLHYLLPFAIVLLMIAGMPIAKTNAAGGTTGYITTGVNSILLDSPVAIKCYDMEVSLDYSIDIDDVNWINWTNGASETEKVFYRTFTDDDVTAGMIKIELVNTTATVIDTLYLTPTTVDTFFPDELIFALFVPILIAVILVAIVLVIRKRKGA